MRHQGPISGIATNGEFVATAGYDNQVILWDKKYHLPISRGFHDHLVNQVSFSPDGKKLVSASSDYSVRIWNVPTLKLQTLIRDHQDDVEMASFSPDGKFIATCSRDRYVRIFDASGALSTTMCGHSDDVISVAWDIDCCHVYSSSDDGTVRCWDSKSGNLIHMYEFNDVQADTLIVTQHGQILIGDDNGQLIVIHNNELRKNKVHDSGIKRLIMNNKNGLIASLSYDRTMAIWLPNKDLTLTQIDRTEVPPIVWPRSGTFLDDQTIATGTFGSSYAIYKIPQKTWQFNGINSYKNINALCLSNGSIYSVGDAGIVYKDDLPVMHLGSLCNFILSSNHRIICGGQLGKLFDAITGELLYQHHSPINCGTTYSYGGIEYVALGTYSGEIIVINLSIHQVKYVATLSLHNN
ncbi:MAG: WD40 repeat domain-containing protein [Nitrospira sp.]|nr:WD40 repeat domain-containing protein [Nitrospira sp.]